MVKSKCVNYKKFTSQRRFGIEFEIDNKITKVKIKNAIKSVSDHNSLITKYQPSTENNYWHIKNDATCGPLGRFGPKGVEVASYVGSGIVDLQHIAEVAEKLIQIGCQVNENCGLHIHADSADLTKAQVGAILAYWIKIEKCLQHALPARRINNVYCQMSRDKYLGKYHFSDSDFTVLFPKGTASENFYHIFSPTNLGYFENEDRRVNLNLVNYARACYYGNSVRKTLELRWPEGTLNPLDVKCWTRLFLNFIETCKNKSFPQNINECTISELLSCFGLEHENDFTIFSEGLFETKTWLLERIVQYSTNKNYKKEAIKVLNLIWSPIKKYI